MLARASNRHGIEKFEEIEVEAAKYGVRCAVISGKVGPFVEYPLCPSKHLLDARREIQFVGKPLRVAFVGEGELVAISTLVLTPCCMTCRMRRW